MLMIFRNPRFASALLAALALTLAAPEAFARKAVVGPVAIEVPDDFKDVSGATTPAVHQDSSGVTIEASELPPQALQDFKGQVFLDYLQSLGFTNPAFADGALKRTDAHTYVLADAKGGAESRFLLVIGGDGRAAIITAYAPKSELANGHASRAGIEAILDSASLVTSGASKP